jgi:hypothetical protein
VKLAATQPRWFSPPQIADQLAVDAAKVLRWINSGQICAVNVATGLAGRPRWRISEEELFAFLRRRQSRPAAPLEKRRPRKMKGIVSFF